METFKVYSLKHPGGYIRRSSSMLRLISQLVLFKHEKVVGVEKMVNGKFRKVEIPSEVARLMYN